MKRLWIIGLIAVLLLSGLVAQNNTVDLTKLPIGDGKLSTEPVVGSVWSCETNFDSGIGGSHANGPWINSSTNTYDATAKAIVDGEVDWDGIMEVTVVGDERIITTNGVPTFHPTGIYPISSSDDAYQYDRNPNTITEQDERLVLPANPTIADESSCLSMGAIGRMLSGVVIFNALDALGRDAAAYETQDACEGHPEVTGEYHYHNLSNCVDETDDGDGHSELLGYAYDGFGIYGHRGEDGHILMNEDLDECHGETHMIEWDGQMVEMYHYHATYEYPYLLGCYRGTPVVTGGTSTGRSSANGAPGQQQQPPPGGNNNGQNPPPRNGENRNQNPPPTPPGG